MKNLYQSLLALCFLAASSFGFAQVPIYNSYPSAEATIFLDFDGHLVNGTSWNSWGPINCGPSNLNAAQITEVYNRVAEDYRPFHVNVTTDSTRYWAAPAFKRMRVILTITSDWYGPAGGVSMLYSFSWGDNTPCFVFTALLNYNPKRIGEAASHEIGHTLGLLHQSSYDENCLKTAEYNPGKGSGEIGWAPIMGVGYYRNLTLWNNGSDPNGCNSIQDDLGIITSGVNGFGYRNDDHGNSVGPAATTAEMVNNQFNVNGVIEQMSDQDVFKFTITQFGNLRLDAIPYNTGSGNSGSNLDLQAEILNSSGTVTSVYNPENSLNVSVDTMLSAGVYYLRIRGKGNMYAPEYASLGSYNLISSFRPMSPLPLRKLELQGSIESRIHRLQWIIDADEQVVRQELEISANGSDYRLLATMHHHDRNYQYRPTVSANHYYYRLNVLFSNGRQYYSNVVNLRSRPDVQKPSLASNLVNSVLVVQSPAVWNYAVLDFSGRMITKGRLVQGSNNIHVNALSSGMYLIQFYDGQTTMNEKFMKQ